VEASFPPALTRATLQGQIQTFASNDLPQTWPDRLGIRLLFSLLKAPFVKGGTVDVPDALPGPAVPEYARRPFHGLPNGYYSHSVAQGYDTGFEISMLGRVGAARSRMVESMMRHIPGGPQRVLDAGCGTGRLAHALVERGVPEVWGLDPSPYLLQIAGARTPEAHFVQGVLESAPFSDNCFDAVGSCFVFHELPRAVAEASLSQIRRILRPGGVLTIVDPCRDHVRPKSLLRLVASHGASALYFHFLAKGVYEPYLADWHGRASVTQWLEESGFEVLQDQTKIPLQTLVARRK
jgi:ubiquinone/menaquinone biosynthesis C-methylase UbiE